MINKIFHLAQQNVQQILLLYFGSIERIGETGICQFATLARIQYCVFTQYVNTR
jgi:CO dehydrogenase nickel-insertion accessory protein CooC1